jgi:4-deoxy-L-threo-5-hexosulose-uronate ketol-isomerase
MMMNIRYNNHPEDAKTYDTKTLRERFLMEKIFEPDHIIFTYSHHDRIIFGGILPVNEALSLPSTKDLGTNYFLERRELGVINIGGPGYIIIDEIRYEMNEKDGMYIGLGHPDVQFGSIQSNNPAKYYINSAPAHRSYPTVHIPINQAKPNRWGAPKTLNERTIYQYVHPAVCQSCQLVMGMTILSPGSSWNTMPCHTHERRMEVYFYFNMESDTRVFHFMGKPEETRHLVIKNEQAVISPSWSIHSGVGTSNYTFIWGMCGENQTFDDMDFVSMSSLT